MSQYTSGISIHIWFLNTHLVSQYTPSISIHIWYLNTHLVSQYTSGISIHTWYLNTHTVYQYMSGISIHIQYLNTCLVLVVLQVRSTSRSGLDKSSVVNVHTQRVVTAWRESDGVVSSPAGLGVTNGYHQVSLSCESSTLKEPITAHSSCSGHLNSEGTHHSPKQMFWSPE